MQLFGLSEVERRGIPVARWQPAPPERETAREDQVKSVGEVEGVAGCNDGSWCNFCW